MQEGNEIKGYYGSQNTPCTIFSYKNWYVVEGSVNVNRTYEELNLGVNVEEIDDFDVFTTSEPINTLEELKEAVDDE